MNRGWSKVARGKHEMSDRTKFESIKVLNNALMERLGEVTGQLIRCQEELSALKGKYEGEIPNVEPGDQAQPQEPDSL
jgi:hypothetical protein